MLTSKADVVSMRREGPTFVRRISTILPKRSVQTSSPVRAPVPGSSRCARGRSSFVAVRIQQFRRPETPGAPVCAARQEPCSPVRGCTRQPYPASVPHNRARYSTVIFKLLHSNKPVCPPTCRETHSGGFVSVGEAPSPTHVKNKYGFEERYQSLRR
jgi:hypothetical protein